MEVLREVEVLWDVEEQHTEVTWQGLAPRKGSQYVHIIRSYVHCFAAVMRYHNLRMALRTDKNKEPAEGGVVRFATSSPATIACRGWRRCGATRGGRSSAALRYCAKRRERVPSNGPPRLRVWELCNTLL